MRTRPRRLPAGFLLCAFLTLAGPAGRAAADEAHVARREAIGPYLAVRLMGGEEHHLLLPVSDACLALSKPEGRVTFVDRGFPGRLEHGDMRCEASGVMDLARTRDRRPRAGTPFAPRKTAFWETVHRDGRHALLRGRFPLSFLVGIGGGGDLVAVVADDAACAAAIEGERGSLEFRDTGAHAFFLRAGEQRCPILGFARPPPGKP